MSDIFLSYSNEDRQRIVPLAQALEAEGWSVFWDRTIPAGRTWRQVIGREIKDSRCVMVFWTLHSVESTWVQEEAEEGKRRDILLPVMLDNVVPPFGFGNIQAADLTGWTGSPDAAAFQRLVKDASQISGMPPRARAATGDPPRRSVAGLPRSVERLPSEPARSGEPKLEPSVATARPSELRRGSHLGLWLKLAGVGVGVAVIAAALIQLSDREATELPPPPAGSPVTQMKPEPVPPAVAAPPEVAKPRPEAEISVLSLTAPPPDYFVLDTIVRKPDTSLRLTEVSARGNNITDEEEWWVGNRLDPMTYQVPNPFRQIEGDLPSVVPTRFRGLRVVSAIRANPILAVYGENFSDGRYLLAVDPSSGGVPLAMDFSAFLWPHQFNQSERDYVRMSTEWAHLEAGILYVSHAHNTYARSSKGYNAYVSAVDTRTGALLWRSRPLVSNARNFIVRGDAIVAGYGFSGESDFLYVLNKADGRIVQRVSVKSGPDYLVEKEGRLYVRTYNTDYVFRYSTQ